MRELAETIEFGHLVAIDADRHESRLDHRERGRVEVCAPLHLCRGGAAVVIDAQQQRLAVATCAFDRARAPGLPGDAC